MKYLFLGVSTRSASHDDTTSSRHDEAARRVETRGKPPAAQCIVRAKSLDGRCPA